MLVNKGNKVPDTEGALILWPAWENGYEGKFYKGNNAFCVGCNYTLLVSAKTAGYLNIGAAAAGQFTDLNTYPRDTIFDNVVAGAL